MLVVLVGLIALLSWPEKLDIIDILINYIFRLDIQILIFSLHTQAPHPMIRSWFFGWRLSLLQLFKECGVIATLSGSPRI